MPVGYHLSEILRAKIRRLYLEEGLTPEVICVRINVSKKTIYTAITNKGERICTACGKHGIEKEAFHRNGLNRMGAVKYSSTCKSCAGVKRTHKPHEPIGFQGGRKPNPIADRKPGLKPEPMEPSYVE